MDHLPLFVYGTLRPGEVNYRRFLQGRIQEEAPARLLGAALYTEGQYPYLVTEDEPGACVYGYLILPRFDMYTETLRQIDWLEDYKPLSPWSLYLRETRTVETERGRRTAWAYIAGPRTLAAIRAGGLTRVVDGRWPCYGVAAQA